jgi:hypothetical protein
MIQTRKLALAQNGIRFSEKLMLKQKITPESDLTWLNQTPAEFFTSAVPNRPGSPILRNTGRSRNKPAVQ